MKTGRPFALAATLLVLASPAIAAGRPGSLTITQRGGGPGPAFGVGGLPGVAGRGGSAAFPSPGYRGGHGGGQGHDHGDPRGWNYGYAGFGGYGDGLIVDPESLRDQGYFAGSANSWVEGGKAAYDYDRAYPYDWYRDRPARAALVRSEARPDAMPEYRCSLERAGVRVCRGR